LGNHDLFSATAAFFHGSNGNRSSFFFSGNISTKALWQFYEDNLNRVDLSWVFYCLDSLFWTSFSGDFGKWPALEESRVDAIQIEFDILRWHPQISFEGTNPPYPLLALGYEPYMRQAQS
jgi:hypothetical protein